MQICSYWEATYRYNPAADVFIQTNFSPKQDKHTAIPERLSLWKGQFYILDNEKGMLTLLTMYENIVICHSYLILICQVVAVLVIGTKYCINHHADKTQPKPVDSWYKTERK